MIYFIEAVGTGTVKIGFTDGEPENRLRQLQTASPHHLRLLATLPGTLDHEKKTHEYFVALRVNGEWFRYEGELQMLITFAKWFSPRITAIEDRLDKLWNWNKGMDSQNTNLWDDHWELLEAIKDQSQMFLDFYHQKTGGTPAADAAAHGLPAITDRIRRQVLEEFESMTQMSDFLDGPRGRE